MVCSVRRGRERGYSTLIAAYDAGGREEEKSKWKKAGRPEKQSFPTVPPCV